MAKFILAASPDAGFRETLRSSLTDAGGYNVVLAASGADVLSSIGNLAFDVAILDSQLSDFPLPALVDAVKLKLSEAKILVVPSTDPLSSLTLEECGADAFINKPFFVPDLLEVIQKLIHGESVQEGTSVEKPFQEEAPTGMRDIFSEEIAKVEWPAEIDTGKDGNDIFSTLILPLEDVLSATQPNPENGQGSRPGTEALKEIPPAQFLEMEELAKWFSESTARSAILVSGLEVVATSGDIDSDTGKKLTEEIPARFKASEAKELIRFIPPQHGTGNQLLFAAVLGSEKYIVLLYEASTSYSLIREQADRLRRRLADSAMPTLLQPEEVTQAWSTETPGSEAAETVPIIESDQAQPSEIPVEEQPLAITDPFGQTGFEEKADEIKFSTPESPDSQVSFESIAGAKSDDLPSGQEIVGENSPLESREVAASPTGPLHPVESQDVEIPQEVVENTEAKPPAAVESFEPGKEQPGSEEYPWLAGGLGVNAASIAEEELSPLPDALASAFPWEEDTSTKAEVSNSGESLPDEGIPISNNQEQEFEKPKAPLFHEPDGTGTPAETEPEERITTAELTLKTPPEGNTRNLRVFILVPADPSIFLTGKLAGELGDWIPQVCESMAWEVDALAVRPEFVRIGLVAAPDQTDEIITCTLQDATARLVASSYPQMELNPEKPFFWADDFLKINPNDPPDQSELNAFIHHLRR
jgi:CheY-like chemotaxis protein/REP element-mobilizing transposase RayT